MLQFFSFLEVPHKILVYFMCVNITLQSIAIENGTEEGTRPIESEISLACKFIFFCL